MSVKCDFLKAQLWAAALLVRVTPASGPVAESVRQLTTIQLKKLCEAVAVIISQLGFFRSSHFGSPTKDPAATPHAADRGNSVSLNSSTRQLRLLSIR